jgi:hypothetical protein
MSDSTQPITTTVQLTEQERLILKARDLSDPGFTLSLPEPTKQVIRDLLGLVAATQADVVARDAVIAATTSELQTGSFDRFRACTEDGLAPFFSDQEDVVSAVFMAIEHLAKSPLDALEAMTAELLARAAEEPYRHAPVVGPYFNLVCKCGHKGGTVSENGDFERHVAESIRGLAAAQPTTVRD